MSVASERLPVSPQVYTYESYMEEYLTGPVERLSYYIDDGVKIYLNSPSWSHQRILFAMSEIFLRFERTSGKGYALFAPFDILIRRSPLRTRQPDLLFISKERFAQGGGVPKGPLTVAPELAAEIISDSERAGLLKAKMDDYAAIGVEECWVVRPEPQTVEVMRLAAEGWVSAAVYNRTDVVRSIAFPDLSVPVSGIFSLK